MIERLSYGDIRGQLEPDGSLRDLYVFETSVDDWLKFLEMVVADTCPAQLTVNGENTREIRRAVRAFDDDEVTASVTVQVGAITLTGSG